MALPTTFIVPRSPPHRYSADMTRRLSRNASRGSQSRFILAIRIRTSRAGADGLDGPAARSVSYPRVSISGSGRDIAAHVELARAINQNIEVVEGKGDFAIGIGLHARPGCATPVFAGSNGWDALLSLEAPQDVGATRNPFGAGAAACLAVGEILGLLTTGLPQSLQRRFRRSTWRRSPVLTMQVSMAPTLERPSLLASVRSATPLFGRWDALRSAVNCTLSIISERS